jgi:hypothetical protein
MKKLKLEVEDLRVETFDTKGGTGDRGTVVGHSTYVITKDAELCDTAGSGCDTGDGVCGAGTYGGACNTSGMCDDISACWGTMC